jgi:hypothetical protein
LSVCAANFILSLPSVYAHYASVRSGRELTLCELYPSLLLPA